MIRTTPIVLFLSFANLFATQEFNLEIMKSYLTSENLYVYKALGKQYVTQEKLNFQRGIFDTKLAGKLEEKDYPSGNATYYDISLEKPTESGVDFSVGYRYAKGTQEYNNIKTGENGELIFGAKIPLLSVINKTDQRRLGVGLARMDLEKTKLGYEDDMRVFYFQLMTSYFTLLYRVDLEKLSQEILYKMKKREDFLRINVEKGNLPRINLLDAKQQVIHAKQNYISAQRDSKNTLIDFLKYINLSDEVFKKNYHLPSLPSAGKNYLSFDKAYLIAINNRPDLEMLNVERKKLFLENKNNNIKKYPELNLGLNGLYNEDEETGFKVTLDVKFPLAQSQYRAKKSEIDQSVKIVNNESKLQLLTLKSNLLSVINSLDLIIENVDNSKEEIALLQELEKLEKRKYDLGSSTLFILNQRETLTIQAKAKLLAYKHQYQLAYQAYVRIISSKNDL